jgi:hypothetical protein
MHKIVLPSILVKTARTVQFTVINADFLAIFVYLANKLTINFDKKNALILCYRKLSLKNTGDTLKRPDGTVLVTAHWVF